MLIEAGLLTNDQLSNAMSGHKKAKLKLGQYLVSQGIISGSQITDLVSRQLNIVKYRPDLYPLDMELSSVLPVEIAQKYQAVPLSKNRFLITSPY